MRVVAHQVAHPIAQQGSGDADLGVGGGRTTVSVGAASLAAAADVRNKILDTASGLLQTQPERLVLRNGRVEIAGIEGSGMTTIALPSRTLSAR